MGFLSKLFGKDGDQLEKAAGSLFGELKGKDGSFPASSAEDFEKPAAQQSSPAPAPAPAAAAGPSGFSWGDQMPAEENQFNSGVSYLEYFSRIFKENFPEYNVEMEMSGTSGTGREVFTFTSGGRVALKVELLSQSSGAYKVRRDCAQSGTPYLRYYYDHHGWWNTKTYVIERTRKALGA